MIAVLSVRFRKYIAWMLYIVFYGEWAMAAEMRDVHMEASATPAYNARPSHTMRDANALNIAPTKPPVIYAIPPASQKEDKAPAAVSYVGGPTQPEMQTFQSVNGNNMVDLFTGDFSYNIPLLDVGGYPVNIAYRSGVGMDDDASWVGLGWNVNPGSITRNMRGLPDDFNGGADTVKKVGHIKPNKTFGATVGFNTELIGLPLPDSINYKMGIFHSTYNGWGMEMGLNASINAGDKAHGPFSGGLSITNNSQTGITITPSLSVRLYEHEATDKGGFGAGSSIFSSYNSRTGIKSLELGLNDKINKIDECTVLREKQTLRSQGDWNTGITFASPTYSPTMTLPMTNYNYSITGKYGGEIFGMHPNLYISGYFGKEYIDDKDTVLQLPAYGYLNYQNIKGNWGALTDFNREKETPYRENPPIRHIAVPAYTYDMFTIMGEGTGGMFRAYRGDIGFIADHRMQSKTYSGALSVDIGGGGGAHWGGDLNANYSTTRTGPWLPGNLLAHTIGFRPNDSIFQSSYFRNPGEKTINTTAFYDAIGGDNVVAPVLYQSGNSDPNIVTTNGLNVYNKGKQVGSLTLDSTKSHKGSRDKRSEVISYLTATEASVSGLDKHIVHYAVNKFAPQCCSVYVPEDTTGQSGTGLIGYYYNNEFLQGQPVRQRLDPRIYFDWNSGSPYWSQMGEFDQQVMDGNFFSARWLGRIKIPDTGCYKLAIKSDDGVRLWLNDSLVIDDWHGHPEKWDSVTLNLVGSKFYNLRLEYFELMGNAVVFLTWKRPGEAEHAFTPQQDSIPGKYLYPPYTIDTIALDSIRTQEERVNNFRKSSHISEIDVLNPDGKRYVYGIPVYNLVQKEVSFSADVSRANLNTGLTGYSSDSDASTKNINGKDGYYSREEIPAYAHSFLLTGILSSDYVDVTGDGISDDDIGDAVKFNYSKTAGIANPYGWRAPYVKDSVNYNEGFRSYNRDDKGHYIYGTKELWYLHSIESKTMVANFILQPRKDLLGVDERGNKTDSLKAMCLKQINLYSKVDYMKHGDSAVPIKVVHFEYSYELCRGVNYPTYDSGKLTLKRIWFTYNGNEKGVRNPYIFHYHPNNPDYKVNSTDKWGVYKDVSQNPGTTSTNIITNAEYPYALQDSATAAYNAAAWTLDSIKLPSGGRIKVNYESDDYAFVQNRRAALMCNIAGLGKDSTGAYNTHLYEPLNEHLYIYIKVPYVVSGNVDLFTRYLDGISKLYFRINVRMPSDDFGSGSEYVPGYAEPDVSAPHWYGVTSNPNVIWIKVKGVNTAGNADGGLSPLAQTAINYLRLNLPSKAYPGSEVNEDLNFPDLVKIVVSMAGNILELLQGYSNTARGNGWCNQIDVSRSFVRLDCPTFKKYGGGLRVKSVFIYDNWDSMAKKKPAVYGQTYSYTTTRNVNGVPTTISSGVASWEPTVGGEENPFHLPIEFVDKVTILAPAAAMYTEEPLGETFYPGASIGYSKVRVRSIHTTGTRSANGYAETSFYTSYDFPTSWDWSLLDNSTKKRYKPILNNFLRINAMNYLTMSQGFKVELNDMNGKLRSEATYAETDSVHPISYTENFYKVDDQAAAFKHLSNTVSVVDPQGNIDTMATIGKDAEVMSDMREQVSTSIGANINVNGDMFTAGGWPLILPSLLNLFQKETNQFRSAAMMKIIHRYGILDSVVHVDKGSTVGSKNLLYDGETGDPVLVRTVNEFNDPVYQFSYPAHWAYSAAGPAYQNIDAIFYNCTIDHGKLSDSTDAAKPYLMAGDELIVYSKESVPAGCTPAYAYFADAYKLWVIDTNTVYGGKPGLMLVDRQGKPFSGNDVTLKVTRSGHRNLGSSVGSIVSLGNPLVRDGSGIYHLVLDSTIGVLNAGAAEMQQYWKVADKRTTDITTSCVYTAADSAEFSAEGCSCLKPFFDYLISHHLLYIPKGLRITVGALVEKANAAGYPIDLGSCPLLNANASLPFYSTTLNPNWNIYIAHIGNVQVDIRDIHNGNIIPFDNLVSTTCDAQGRPHFRLPGTAPRRADTVTVKIYPDLSANLFSMIGTTCPYNSDSLTIVDTTSDHLMVENGLLVGGYKRNSVAILRWDTPQKRIPFWANVLSARMILQADIRGHIPGTYNNANSILPNDTTGYSLSAPAGWFNYQPLDTMIYQAYYSPWYEGMANKSPFQNDTLDVMSYVNNYLSGVYGSPTFILTQGSGPLHDSTYDSSLYVSYVPPNLTHDSTYDSTPVVKHLMPPYLTTGFDNYYSTYYSRRYADSAKWPVIEVTYAETASNDTVDAVLEFNSTITCTTVTGRSCYSSVTDTTVNPYQYGILGNMRPLQSYVYYGRRRESSPYDSTDIRRNGTISGFAPFWQLQSGKWQPVYDTTRWTWNSQTNMYNRKGFELENADPLGRYNSGLYGYGLTLPTAVVQNGRYQEIAFDGFEDYGFTPNTCDTLCPESRPFDFSSYKSYISDSMAHTGIYSLRIGKDSSVSLSVIVSDTPTTPSPQLLTKDSAGYFMGDRAGVATVLPSFSPLAGRKMLVSAWVKEKNVCTCQSYTRDHIQLSFSQSSGGTSLTLQPSGNMIEGWQRVEAVVFIPSNATAMTLTLEASDSSTTYFDDIRILPYNGEMKSYVYNPVNLRLMAELDENNYATFYEYDDDGTLIRVKKETERGIQTIKESRSALLKKQ
jgi:hypothetical protein